MKLYHYEEYCQKVDQLYQDLKSEVASLFPDAYIEHIGSSSIPHSISKGDLDVFLGVPHDQFDSTIIALGKIGYVEKQGTFRSHELCMMITDKYSYDVAIQVVANGSEFEDFLRFKQALLDSPELVEKYNQIKLSAQSLTEDEYREKKAEFIQDVLQGLNEQ